MGDNKKIAKNSIYIGLQLVFVLIVSLYTSRVVLQVLGVEDFGIYNVVCGFVAMFSFLNTSMNNAIQRFYNYEYGKHGVDGATKVFNTAILIQILLAIFIVIATESLGLWYLYEKMVIPQDRFDAAFWIFQFSVISLVFLILQIPFSASILAHEKMSYYAIVNITDAILKLGIALSIPYIDGDKLIGYGFLMVIISVINIALYVGYSRRHFQEIKIKREFHKSLFKDMLSFSGWNLFGSIAGVGKEQGVNMVLNLFFGPVVNAARGIAYQVSGALQGFVTTVTISGRPQLTQSYAQGDIKRTFNLMYSLSKLSFIILFLFSLPVMMEIDYILTIWLGTELPPFTGRFVVLVIMSAIAGVLNPPTSFVVHATGKMAKYQSYSSIISLMILPTSYFVLRAGGAAESVFVLGIVFNTINQLVCLLVLKSLVYFSLLEYCKSVILPVVLVAIPSLILPYLAKTNMDEGFLRLLVVTILSVGSVAISAFLLALNTEEKQIVSGFIKNRIDRRNNHQS